MQSGPKTPEQLRGLVQETQRSAGTGQPQGDGSQGAGAGPAHQARETEKQQTNVETGTVDRPNVLRSRGQGPQAATPGGVQVRQGGGGAVSEAPEPTVVRLPEGRAAGKPVMNPGDGRFAGHAHARPTRRSMIARARSFGIGKITFVLFVVLPTLVTALYFAFLASDQYAVEAQFAVRTKETGGASMDGLSILSGITGSAPSASDSYIVENFIGSRDLVDKVDEDLDLRKLFARPEADFFASVDKDAPIEDLLEYWRTMVTTEFDQYSGIITLTVRAFRPEDAVAVGQKVIGFSEALVNDLSRRAREDAVSEAKSEVARAENRLRLARRAVARFRGDERRLNPVATAEAREKIIAGLEGERAKLETQRAAIMGMSPNSPRLTSIESQIEAVAKQIEAVRLQTNQNDGDGEGTLNQQLSQYEELQTEREFAERAYVSSLASLEKARLEAVSQNRYLAVFVQPMLPDLALYPEGVRWTLTVLVAAFLFWAISGLIVASVRDHVA
ncbi:hypothetical protein [Breoghania sp.]|uniref:hypothetical protein n=1 Tax=Breoghania sp. TaxID=2065378 RepID=UPI002AA8A9D4|nr:hypothetical protein [Breoghania sp.]